MRTAWILLVINLIAFCITSVVEVNYFVAGLLFFGVPCVWLTTKLHSNIRSAAQFAILFGLPLTMVFDYFAIVNQAWVVSTMFPFLIGGVVPVEDAWLGTMLSYEVAMLGSLISNRLIGSLNKKLLYTSTCMLLALFMLFVWLPQEQLAVRYAYGWIGLCVTILPLALVEVRNRTLHSTLIKLSLLAFVPLLLFEIVGLHQDFWTFPSNDYLGWVEMFSISFPVEELVFWMILAFPAVACMLEFFRKDAV